MITTSNLKIRLVLFAMSGLLPTAFAHDNHTIHPTLTDKSYDAWALDDDGDFFDNVGIKEADTFSIPTLPSDADSLSATIHIGASAWSLSQPATLKDWLIAGSIDEDAPDTRCLAHFYNPIGTHYLTDPITVSGRDSFEWASAGTSFTPLMGAKPSPGTNQESWVKAREYYFDALTKSSKIDREANLAHTFYAIGKVSHLLQDLSQPEHVRNDAHMVNGSDTPVIGGLGNKIVPEARWIENYGRDKIVTIAAWPELDGVTPLDWKPAGFKKMEDFWNRHVYTGSGSDLDADASGTKLLGLSEFVNGNFLGADAGYQSTKSKHYFPHPALADTNISTYGVHDVLPASTWRTGATVNPKSGIIRQSVFLRKDRSGVVVDRHSVLNYSQFYSGRILGVESPHMDAKTTINAPDVLENYHKVVLPKAIKYTAGIMDYFLRGKLEVRVTWDEENEEYKLDITNKSGDSLKGGAFTLYADDSGDTRTAVSSLAVKLEGDAWSSSSILADEAIANATFKPSSTQSKGFILVYKGTIGLDSGNAANDSLDEGKAIAAYHFQILRFNIKWDKNDDIDLYLRDPDGALIYYSDKVSDLGELDIDDIPGTGPENITLKRLVPGDYKVYANFYFTHYEEDDLSVDPPVIHPVNVTMKTYYNSSTPLDTVNFNLENFNYGSDIPEETAGPATQQYWYIRKKVTVDEEGKVTQH